MSESPSPPNVERKQHEIYREIQQEFVTSSHKRKLDNSNLPNFSSVSSNVTTSTALMKRPRPETTTKPTLDEAKGRIEVDILPWLAKESYIWTLRSTPERDLEKVYETLAEEHGRYPEFYFNVGM